MRMETLPGAKMLVITVCHYVKPGRIGDAKLRIGSNTEEMVRLPGLIFRHTGSSADAPDRIITVTGWRSAADRNRWDSIKSKITYPPDQVDLYESFEIFEVEVFDARWAADLPAREQKTSNTEKR